MCLVRAIYLAQQQWKLDKGPLWYRDDLSTKDTFSTLYEYYSVLFDLRDRDDLSINDKSVHSVPCSEVPCIVVIICTLDTWVKVFCVYLIHSYRKQHIENLDTGMNVASTHTRIEYRGYQNLDSGDGEVVLKRVSTRRGRENKRRVTKSGGWREEDVPLVKSIEEESMENAYGAVTKDIIVWYMIVWCITKKDVCNS